MDSKISQARYHDQGALSKKHDDPEYAERDGVSTSTPTEMNRPKLLNWNDMVHGVSLLKPRGPSSRRGAMVMNADLIQQPCSGDITTCPSHDKALQIPNKLSDETNHPKSSKTFSTIPNRDTHCTIPVITPTSPLESVAVAPAKLPATSETHSHNPQNSIEKNPSSVNSLQPAKSLTIQINNKVRVVDLPIDKIQKPQKKQLSDTMYDSLDCPRHVAKKARTVDLTDTQSSPRICAVCRMKSHTTADCKFARACPACGLSNHLLSNCRFVEQNHPDRNEQTDKPFLLSKAGKNYKNATGHSFLKFDVTIENSIQPSRSSVGMEFEEGEMEEGLRGAATREVRLVVPAAAPAPFSSSSRRVVSVSEEHDTTPMEVSSIRMEKSPSGCTGCGRSNHRFSECKYVNQQIPHANVNWDRTTSFLDSEVGKKYFSYFGESVLIYRYVLPSVDATANGKGSEERSIGRKRPLSVEATNPQGDLFNDDDSVSLLTKLISPLSTERSSFFAAHRNASNASDTNAERNAATPKSSSPQKSNKKDDLPSEKHANKSNDLRDSTAEEKRATGENPKSKARSAASIPADAISASKTKKSPSKVIDLLMDVEDTQPPTALTVKRARKEDSELEAMNDCYFCGRENHRSADCSLKSHANANRNRNVSFIQSPIGMEYFRQTGQKFLKHKVVIVVRELPDTAVKKAADAAPKKPEKAKKGEGGGLSNPTPHRNNSTEMKGSGEPSQEASNLTMQDAKAVSISAASSRQDMPSAPSG